MKPQNQILSIRNLRYPFLLVVALLCYVGSCVAQPSDSTVFYPKRAWLVGSVGAVGSAGTLVGLSQLWYSEEPMQNFHFFNDDLDWLQMDKAGHTITAYNLGNLGIKALKWSGTKRKKAVWYGGMYGFFYLTSVEVLDGFSKEWGFSMGDMAANALGTGVVIAQELLWDEQRVRMKFSAGFTKYAAYRPDVLGSSAMERLLKDYNGQTYWLSANPAAWMKQKPNWFPGWLNLAVGYGVDGLTGGTENPTVSKTGQPLPYFPRQRQFYLSVDVDLTRIKTRSKVLKTCFELLSFIKIPAPAIELNSTGKLRGHWLHF